MALYRRYRVFSIAPELNVMLTVIGRRLHGPCWNTLICLLRDIFEPHISPYMPLYLVVSLGGSKTGMESSAAKNPPSQINGAFSFSSSLRSSFLASSSTFSFFPRHLLPLLFS